MEATLSGTDSAAISVPADIAATIDAIALARHITRDRALIDLVRDGIAAYEHRRAAFLQLAERFQESTDSAETERLREELAQMTFGR